MGRSAINALLLYSELLRFWQDATMLKYAKILLALCAVTCIAGPGYTQGRTVNVSSVAQLRSALANRSVQTIIVAPGNYMVSDVQYAFGSGDGFHIAHDVTIIGGTSPENRANFFAATDFSKGIFHVAEGASATFQNVGFAFTRREFGGSSSSNEAAIRHEGVNLSILNCHFENNLNAILGTSISGPGGRNHGDLLVRGSTFMFNGDQGGAGQEHHIYFTGRSAVIDSSRFYHSGFGHAIKTVVDTGTTVTNTLVDDRGAKANSAINVTGGGALTVVGNMLIKSKESENPYFIFYETVRDGGVTGAINIANNKFTSLKPVEKGNPVQILGNFSDATAKIAANQLSGGFNLINPVDGDAVATGNLHNGQPYAFPTFRSYAQQGTPANNALRFASGKTGYMNHDPVQAYNGGAGDDVIIGDFGGYSINALFGGLGNDVISGGDGNDFLYGEGGDDVLFAGNTSYYTTTDYMFGGPGNDRLYIRPLRKDNQQNAYFDGGEGNDLVDARNADHSTFVGGGGDDIFIGSNGQDLINGGYGNDIVYGGLGSEDEYFNGGTADDPGTDIAVYAGSFGRDLTVGFRYNNPDLPLITALSGAGKQELGNGEEMPLQFEYIQFANGLYDIRAQRFMAGEMRVDLRRLLAMPIPADPGER
jgi:Ca2+-binding RTX toxin-like protein